MHAHSTNCCAFWVSLLNFSQNINKLISNSPPRAALSTWKSVAWIEIWVLRMLSRGSNSNTPIPSMQQQRDAPLIICMPCNDSERETGIYKWVESSASILQCREDNVLGVGWKVEDKKGRSGREMTSSNTHSVQDNGKTQRGFTMPARFACRLGLRECYDRNINSITAAGLECRKKIIWRF